jgi:hypothetical protein
MAAAKKKKTRRQLAAARAAALRRRRRRWSDDPIEQRWRLWNHDVDTFLHHMAQNPGLNDLSPAAFVERCWTLETDS